MSGFIRRFSFFSAQRSSPFLGRKGGPPLGARRHPLLMVGTDPLEVDRILAKQKATGIVSLNEGERRTLRRATEQARRAS